MALIAENFVLINWMGEKTLEDLGGEAIHGVKEEAKEKASDNGVGDSAEHGHMTVTGLKMVSESCSK